MRIQEKNSQLPVSKIFFLCVECPEPQTNNKYKYLREVGEYKLKMYLIDLT